MREMQPGRELDVMVAEQAMGWSDIKTNGTVWYGRPPVGDAQHKSMIIDLPRFSTDIAAAWSLVEEYRLVVRPSVLTGKWCAGRFVRVYLSGKVETDNDVTGVTAAHAICLAALRVVW